MTDKHDKHHKHGHHKQKQDQKKAHHQHVNKYAEKIQNPSTNPVIDVISQKNREFEAHNYKPTAGKHEYDRRENQKHKK